MTTGTEITPRRGWYHGWNIIAVCVLSQVAANGLVINSFSLFLHDWSVDLNSPISTLQVGYSLMGLTNAAASVVVGIFADRYPTRWVLCCGLVTMALTCAAVSLVTQTWQLQLLFALPIPCAVAAAAGIPANAIVSRWFVRRRGLALGLTSFGLALAGIVLPPLIGTFMPEVGWRMIWRIGALVIGIIIMPIVVLVLRNRPAERDGTYYVIGESTGISLHDRGGGGDAGGLTWRDVFRRRNFWLMVVVYLPMIALYGVGLSNLGPITINRGMGPQTAGYLLAIFSISHSVSTILMGVLSDRFGNRRPLVGLAFATALGGIVIAFGYDIGVLGLGMILIGLSGGVWPLLASVTAMEFGTAGFGRAFGLVMAFLPVISISPYAVAKVQELTGSYVPSMLGLTALTIAGGIACSFMREPRDNEVVGAAALLGRAS